MTLERSTITSLSGLHTKTVEHGRAFIYRSVALVQLSAIIMLMFHRFAFFFTTPITHNVPLFLVSFAECLITVFWLHLQAFFMKPVSREVHPERLPHDDHLPKLDVFIFTADPIKEPTVDVMNTVLSALALDYPPDKLHVYLSDDAGDKITLFAMQESWNFAATSWLQFTKKYGIKTLSPEEYFYGDDYGDDGSSLTDLSPEFANEKEAVKLEFDKLKNKITAARDGAVYESGSCKDHSCVIQVFKEHEAVQSRLPLLVYLAREKRPLKPHHFKAGAINVLLRVSASLSNSPYILFLDCDMNCNDPMSAKQAMCFHLDQPFSSDLSFVQFPQKFRRLPKIDIYDSEFHDVYRILWHGMDGLCGPILSGTNFYIKRASLYGPPGESEKRTSCQKSVEQAEECKYLARVEYDDGLHWGEDVGFRYFTAMEDVFTGFAALHCNGWKSVYYNPKRAAFLGFPVTSFSTMMIQQTRMFSSYFDISISRYSPLIYGLSKKMNVLACMCYMYLTWTPFLCSVSVWLMGTVPQLCVVFGISMNDAPTARILELFLFGCSFARAFFESWETGGTVQSAIATFRIGIMKSVTCFTYGWLQGLMKALKLRKQDFILTEKVEDKARENMYKMGRFDFRASRWFVCPLVSLVLLNLVAVVVGVARMCISGEVANAVEVLFCVFVLTIGFPLIDGVFFRNDKRRVLPHDAFISAVSVVVFLLLGYWFCWEINSGAN